MLDDPCTVTALGVDATNTLQGEIDKQFARFAADADSTIPLAGDLKPLADSLFTSFLEPTALDSTNSPWLVFDPQAVRVTPLAGNGNSISTTLVLCARPRAIAGVRPAARRTPLPVLSLGTAPAEYTVPVSVELPFAKLERRAELLLTGSVGAGHARRECLCIQRACAGHAGQRVHRPHGVGVTARTAVAHVSAALGCHGSGAPAR